MEPGQSFIMHIAVDHKYREHVERALKVLFSSIIEEGLDGYRVKEHRGLGLSIGFGGKMGWGLFKAVVREATVREEEDIRGEIVEALTMAPTIEREGVRLISGAYRNVRYIKRRVLGRFYHAEGLEPIEFDSSMMVAEGSVVEIDSNKVPLRRIAVKLGEDLNFVVLLELESMVLRREVYYGGQPLMKGLKAVEPMYMSVW